MESQTNDLVEYTYAPLSDARCIRLLQFHDEKIEECSVTVRSLTLTEHDIDELPDFTAISYTWGNPVSTESPQPEWDDAICFVIIDGASLSIRKNIMLFLTKLARSVRRTTLFWIDAICINQEDLPERAAQVLLMGSIHTQAQEVIVWMGEDDEAPAILEAVQLLWTTIYHGKEGPVWEWMITHNPHDVTTREACGIQSKELWQDLWSKFFRLFERYAWFHRAWVIQEVQVATNVQWWCHTHHGDLNILCSFTHDLKKSDWLRQLSPSDSTLDYNPVLTIQLLRHITPGFEGGWELFASLIYGAVTNEQRRFAYLLYLIQQFRPSRATVPADKIYSTLAIAAAGTNALPSRWMQPDYEKNVRCVFTEVTALMLEILPAAAILSLVEVRETSIGYELPSWVPDFTIPASHKPLMHIGAVRPEDNSSEVPDPVSVQSGGIYNAWPGGHNSVEVNGYRLYMVGAAVDAVEEVVPYAPDHPRTLMELLFFCTDLPLTDSRTGRTRRETLCRTLIADCWTSHPAPTTALSAFDLMIAFYLALIPLTNPSREATKSMRICMEHFREHASDVLPDEELLERVMSDLLAVIQSAEGNDPVALEVVDRLSAAKAKVEEFLGLSTFIMRSRFLYRTKCGYVGFAHKTIQAGDEIWLLRGGRSFYALRQQPQADYKLIGEAYLQGSMHGEMLTPALLERSHSICIT